jgi:hypothetical protein
MPRPSLRLVPGAAPPPGPVAESHPALAPATEFAVLGLGLTLTIAVMARLPDWSRALSAFQTLYAVAFGFFALAALRLRRYRAVPASGLLVMAVALATRAALLPVTPTLSDDIHRYVWEGRVLAEGGDPYHQAPIDPRLTRLRDPRVWPRVNHPELATIYPPAAEAGFALVAKISPTVAAMKTWVLLHDLALVGALLLWSGRSEAGAAAALVYAWNPLVLVEYAGSGHNEPTALLFMVLAFVLAERRPVLSGLALAIGALVKLAPLAALPFLMRRWSTRGRIACLALLVPGLAWYWMLTRGSDSGLHAYWETWRNNALLFDLLERITGRYGVARLIAIAATLAVGAVAIARAWPAARATRDVLRAGALLSPVLHPWYLGWPLVFEPLAPSAPWLLLTLTATMNYGVFAAPGLRASYHLPLAGRWVEYGAPFALAVALFVWRRAAWRRRGGSSDA